MKTVDNELNIYLKPVNENNFIDVFDLKLGNGI